MIGPKHSDVTSAQVSILRHTAALLWVVSTQPMPSDVGFTDRSLGLPVDYGCDGIGQ